MESNPRKVQRLRYSGDFRRVREQGVSSTGRWLVFGVWKKEGNEGGEMPPRFGVVTSRRVGGAVTRNLVRRRIRHIHQMHHAKVQNGFLCVVVARFRAAEATFAELEYEWRKLARKAGVLKSCVS